MNLTVRISDIRVIHDDGKPIGVIMDWTDGTKTKSICEKADRDNFNLDFGLTICVTKKMIEFLKLYDLVDSNETYMKFIDSCHKFLKNKEDAKIAEKERIKAENEAKQKAKQDEAHKRNEAREREIEIQKEAYLRAMKEYQDDWWRGITKPNTSSDWWYSYMSDHTLPDHG